MCRFTLYTGPPIALSTLLTEPSHSLIRQSYHCEERDEPLNGDGFGVAWYAPDAGPEPALFRSVTPAWSNRNLKSLARVVKSPCVLAHVRAATRGEVSEANCHPFAFGRYAFMHNGDVGGFSALRRPLLGELGARAFQLIEGRTDSEHLFATFIDELEKESEGGAQGMLRALRGAMRRVLDLAAKWAPGEHSYLNLAVSDGEAAVVCRYTSDAPERADSLYVHDGGRYECSDGLCRMVAPDEQGAVIVSSERLSADPGWSAVPVNHSVTLRAGVALTIEPLSW
jgi:predicted glutamine amidotransferase